MIVSTSIRYGALLVLLCLASPVLAEECKAPPIEKCPSLYIERCRSDLAFREANSAECLRRQQIKAVTAEAPECKLAPSCAQSAAQKTCIEKAKREGISINIDEFFKSCGLANCPDNLEDIKSEFGSISLNMKEELKNYGDILNLNPENIDSRQTLCKYTREQMVRFKQQASSDRGKLIDPTKRLSVLRACSDHIVTFVENAKRGWPAGLRDSLIRDARRDSEEARAEGSKAETEIRKLESAPLKVQELSEIYTLACKRSANPNPGGK